MALMKTVSQLYIYFFSPIDGTTSVVLRKVQLNQQGFYSCIVDSGVESANLTYELKVYGKFPETFFVFISFYFY